MPFVLLRTFVSMLVAFVGIGLGLLLRQVATRHLNILVYAAMGVLFAVTVCDILPDAKAILSWPAFLAAILSGYILFWLIGKYVYHLCPACAITAFDEATTQRLGQTALLLSVALGIHSTMDGVAVAVGDAIAGKANLGVLFGVSFHKLPEGEALVLLLMAAGYKRWTAVLWALAIESTTMLGGFLGVYMLRGVPLLWLGLLFGHVGGEFLYLVINAVGGFTTHRRLPARLLVIVGGCTFLLTALLLWAVRHFVA